MLAEVLAGAYWSQDSFVGGIVNLHALIADGNLEAVTAALAAGADVDARSPTDDTPLYAAMRSKALSIVEVLLDHGADPNAMVGHRAARDRRWAWIPRIASDGDDTAVESELGEACPRTVLSASLVPFGNVELVRRLLQAGARVDVADARGWTPLHYAARGRASSDVLELLVNAGADLRARTHNGHTPLVLSCVEWRAMETQRLLRLGASLSEIGWTEWHLGAQMGTLPNPVDASVNIEALDIFRRSALHIAFQHRNRTAIHELLDLGANPRIAHPQQGPLLRMALDFAPRQLVERLLTLVDVNETTGGTENTALMANLSDPGHVRLLLDAGADPHIRNRHGELPFQHEYEGNMAVLTMLRPGSDWSPLSAESRAKLLGDPDLELIAPADNAYRWHICGQHNPTDMTNPWWVSLVQKRAAGHEADDVFGDEVEAGPVWSCERFGQSLTRLDDDRFVEIGGESEDWYDQNFCIYNDVVVHLADGSTQIFGFPPQVFPPTDFHSATLVGPYIYVIGNLGYRRQRVHGYTPVYRLTLDTWEMAEVLCSGESPGWLHRHEATLVDGCIHISGGQLFEAEVKDNAHSFSLDLRTGVWKRMGSARLV